MDYIKIFNNQEFVFVVKKLELFTMSFKGGKTINESIISNQYRRG